MKGKNMLNRDLINRMLSKQGGTQKQQQTIADLLTGHGLDTLFVFQAVAGYRNDDRLFPFILVEPVRQGDDIRYRIKYELDSYHGDKCTREKQVYDDLAFEDIKPTLDRIIGCVYAKPRQLPLVDMK